MNPHSDNYVEESFQTFHTTYWLKIMHNYTKFGRKKLNSSEDMGFDTVDSKFPHATPAYSNIPPHKV